VVDVIHTYEGKVTMRSGTSVVRWFAMCSLVAFAACGGGDAEMSETSEAGGSPEMSSAGSEQTTLVRLWATQTPAFGIYVPSERERGARGPDGERLPPLYTAEGAEALAANPLLDYLFLNLEGAYDPPAAGAMREGLDRAGSDLTLLVRIPPVSADGAEAARMRIAETLDAGADGLVIPHVRSLEEAGLVLSMFADAGADVWSPSNPDGNIIAMLMLEDPDAIAQVQAIADLPGYSALACGIGSLTGALDGDREAAEALNIEVLTHATRVGMADMITANATNVEQRVNEGFLGLLMQGPDADAHILMGRAAAGR